MGDWVLPKLTRVISVVQYVGEWSNQCDPATLFGIQRQGSVAVLKQNNTLLCRFECERDVLYRESFSIDVFWNVRVGE